MTQGHRGEVRERAAHAPPFMKPAAAGPAGGSAAGQGGRSRPTGEDGSARPLPRPGTRRHGRPHVADEERRLLRQADADVGEASLRRDATPGANGPWDNEDDRPTAGLSRLYRD